jgi:hypothetical protein
MYINHKTNALYVLYSLLYQGKGNQYCHFKVTKVKDKGYITIESTQQKGIFMGLMPDGKIRPTVDTGEKNTRFYAEVIQCMYANVIRRKLF